MECQKLIQMIHTQRNRRLIEIPRTRFMRLCRCQLIPSLIKVQVLNEGDTRRSDSETSPDQSTIRPEGQSPAGDPSEQNEVYLDFLLIISFLMQAQESNKPAESANTPDTDVYVGNSRL